MSEPKTTLEQDAKVSQAFLLQQSFKSDRLRAAAVAIVKRALESNGEGLWPDDAKLVEAWQKLAVDDKNVVGNAWRWVRRAGLLERMSGRRPSSAENSNGREIAQWQARDRKLCETFLRRQQAAFEPDQKEFKL